MSTPENASSRKSDERLTEDDLGEFVPTLDELESMRKERDIKIVRMGDAVGYSRGGAWQTAVLSGTMSPEKRLLALTVFEFYDRHSYCPIIELM